MKKISRILLVASLLTLSLLLVMGCSKKETKMDKATFESAVNICDDNVTVAHIYNYDGIIDEESIRVVDGKAYVKLSASDEWFAFKSVRRFFTIVEISNRYDAFTLKDGKYTAELLTVKDEEGLSTILSNVTLEFDEDNRLVKLYYEYENGASLDTFTYEFSDYGTTVAPK